ncbi:hypothetical protein QTP88_005024 [Uroleucon formosanum]
MVNLADPIFNRGCQIAALVIVVFGLRAYLKKLKFLFLLNTLTKKNNIIWNVKINTLAVVFAKFSYELRCHFVFALVALYAKEVNNRDELLMKINNVADIIRQTPNLLEKTWNSLHCRMERCIKVNGGHIEQLFLFSITTINYYHWLSCSVFIQIDVSHDFFFSWRFERDKRCDISICMRILQKIRVDCKTAREQYGRLCAALHLVTLNYTVTLIL